MTQQTVDGNMVQQAAERLNKAFRNLERKIAALQEQAQANPEIEILEQENQQLHEALLAEQAENARLKEAVKQLSMQLETSINRVEKLMSMLES